MKKHYFSTGCLILSYITFASTVLLAMASWHTFPRDDSFWFAVWGGGMLIVTVMLGAASSIMYMTPFERDYAQQAKEGTDPWISAITTRS